MIIRELELKLRKRFDFSFEFRESRVADFESNLFFILKDKEKKSPEELFEIYQNELTEILPIFDLELKNGFLNLNFKKDFLIADLKKVLEENNNYFKDDSLKGKNINVEFVSANPTGPLHLGNLRGGPIGEVLSNLLELSGAKVTREFFVNDLGNQSEYFTETVVYHLIGDDKQFPMPEKGYPGEYPKHVAEKLGLDKPEIKTLAQNYAENKDIENLDKLRAIIFPFVAKNMEDDLKKLGINFDVFTFESSLDKQTKETLEKLEKAGVVKEKEGAKWFVAKNNKKLLGDRECVLIRSDGKPSYFLRDIAYHLDKINRGADLMIDILGANHFGHKPRMLATLEVLGHKDKLKVIFYQQVNLKENGKTVGMSKRRGNFITANDILEAVDKDLFKVYLLEKVMSSHLEFDKTNFKESQKNSPAYYLKYISARINGVEKKVGDLDSEPDYKKLGESELNLIKRLVILPYKISKALDALEPHTIYLEAVNFAEVFHKFYEKAPILNEKDKSLAKARLEIVRAAKITADIFAKILGIDLPKKM